jgi:hypothetical protein
MLCYADLVCGHPTRKPYFYVEGLTNMLRCCILHSRESWRVITWTSRHTNPSTQKAPANITNNSDTFHCPAEAIPSSSTPPSQPMTPCNPTAQARFLSSLHEAVRHGLPPPAFLLHHRFFDRIVPLLATLEAPAGLRAAAACLAALHQSAPEGTLHRARLVANPAHLTPLLSALRDALSAASLPQRRHPGALRRLQDSARRRHRVAQVADLELLMLADAAGLWRAGPEHAAHEQLLRASWVWDALKDLLEGWAESQHGTARTLLLYLARVREAAMFPGLQGLVDGVLLRLGRIAVMRGVWLHLPEDAQRERTETFKARFNALARRTGTASRGAGGPPSGPAAAASGDDDTGRIPDVAGSALQGNSSKRVVGGSSQGASSSGHGSKTGDQPGANSTSTVPSSTVPRELQQPTTEEDFNRVSCRDSQQYVQRATGPPPCSARCCTK